MGQRRGLDAYSTKDLRDDQNSSRSQCLPVYELLSAIVDDETLDRIDQELNAGDYRTHKFGDSVFLEKADDQMRSAGQPAAAACVILSQSRCGLPVIGTLGG
jgi:hypothetical protein